MGRTHDHDRAQSDDRIHLNLSVVEFLELITKLSVMLGETTSRECQESILTIDRVVPRSIRGDLLVADPDDPNQFIIRSRGHMPDADDSRSTQYRISKLDAEDILRALELAVEREWGEQIEDYDCGDPVLNLARKMRLVLTEDIQWIRRNID